jgi:hypothetical protein
MDGSLVVTGDPIALVRQRDRDGVLPPIARAILGPGEVPEGPPIRLQLVRGKVQIAEVIEESQLSSPERAWSAGEGCSERAPIALEDRVGPPVQEILYRRAVVVCGDGTRPTRRRQNGDGNECRRQRSFRPTRIR